MSRLDEIRGRHLMGTAYDDYVSEFFPEVQQDIAYLLALIDRQQRVVEAAKASLEIWTRETYRELREALQALEGEK